MGVVPVDADASAATVRAGVGTCVTDNLATGAVTGGGAPPAKSTWSNGAPGGFPLHAQAVRCPVRVMMMASAFPLVHHGRFTISWIPALRSGVRCFAPASPAIHGTGA